MLTALTAAAAGGLAEHAGGPWGAGFGWLFFLIPVFWILVIALVVTLVGRRRWRRAGWDGGPGGPGFAPWARGGAESTLAERFAQGDIDEVEYRARLEVLRANRPDLGR
ncbi:SHOCT domain-containing protein [Compostimonas suwonensis]|uniref:Putative membrane protein n=1 Tax=Compostimonas suwonensis TaxID=1048394 RepID=A0A2M9BUB3_9MICO|nr:hypothetical protein [Compostimonas suwonensis]PJJ61539.1 putative membrane protein [Compostimonas suwonensis]